MQSQKEKRKVYQTKFNSIAVKESIIKDYKDGLTLKDLRWRYDISHMGLIKVLKRYGIYKKERECHLRFTGVERFNALVDYFWGMPLQGIIGKYCINRRTLLDTYDSLVLQKYEFDDLSITTELIAYVKAMGPDIMERIENGERIRTIAESYAIPYIKFRSILYNCGFNIREHRKILYRKMATELKMGAKVKEIAERYNVSIYLVRRCFKMFYGVSLRKYNHIKVRKEMWDRMEKYDFKSQNDRFWRLREAKKAAKRTVTLEDLDLKGSY